MLSDNEHFLDYGALRPQSATAHVPIIDGDLIGNPTQHSEKDD